MQGKKTPITRGNLSNSRRVFSLQVSNTSVKDTCREASSCWKFSKAALFHLDFSDEALFHLSALRKKTWSYSTGRNIHSPHLCSSFALTWWRDLALCFVTCEPAVCSLVSVCSSDHHLWGYRSPVLSPSSLGTLPGRARGKHWVWISLQTPLHCS